MWNEGDVIVFFFNHNAQYILYVYIFFHSAKGIKIRVSMVTCNTPERNSIKQAESFSICLSCVWLRH